MKMLPGARTVVGAVTWAVLRRREVVTERIQVQQQCWIVIGRFVHFPSGLGRSR